MSSSLGKAISNRIGLHKSIPSNLVSATNLLLRGSCMAISETQVWIHGQFQQLSGFKLLCLLENALKHNSEATNYLKLFLNPL